ncbi:hypothetical protein D8674_039535 [Pyrus ussuriensis x Pyrus communis]|uniref:Uncharacterized protein n=1 Tax=Pyrus ussuriensis x Pyrus communis TaxID=2448454 RepID=A0A5N5H0D1_9ROSA|nr:hypothetical protein D8674_039535 [Pyrus ussuriensis x Pyrus communis]
MDQRKPRSVRASVGFSGHPSGSGCGDPPKMVNGTASGGIRVNPTKTSRNVFGISKIVGENDEFCPNHTIADRGFVEKLDGEDLGFKPRVWVRDDGA